MDENLIALIDILLFKLLVIDLNRYLMT